eukprot:GILJ01014549.1.p1 GENE.GILJ01014549.1~~GILJ01014549.1.p1  ORF type:complete len:285 (-),score=24.21 GILJ01014549.1:135-989(-)
MAAFHAGDRIIEEMRSKRIDRLQTSSFRHRAVKERQDVVASTINNEVSGVSETSQEVCLPCPLRRLPDELLTILVCCLEPLEILKMERICRSMQQFCISSPLWESVFLRDHVDFDRSLFVRPETWRAACIKQTATQLAVDKFPLLLRTCCDVGSHGFMRVLGLSGMAVRCKLCDKVEPMEQLDALHKSASGPSKKLMCGSSCANKQHNQLVCFHPHLHHIKGSAKSRSHACLECFLLQQNDTTAVSFLRCVMLLPSDVLTSFRSTGLHKTQAKSISKSQSWSRS